MFSLFPTDLFQLFIFYSYYESTSILFSLNWRIRIKDVVIYMWKKDTKLKYQAIQSFFFVNPKLKEMFQKCYLVKSQELGLVLGEVGPPSILGVSWFL